MSDTVPRKAALSAAQSERIQVVRGLAIIAVVCIHSTPDFSMPVEVFCKPFLNFAVGAFLFLSGLLSDAEKWDPLKRIRKLLIPYALWSLVYVFVNNGTSLSLPAFVTLYGKYLLLGTAATMLYYVFVYCELTLLIPATDRLSRSRFWALGFLISPLEILIFRLAPLLLGVAVHPYLLTVIRVSCLGWFWYFYLGYLIGRGKLENAARRPRAVAALLLVSLAVQMAEAYGYYLLGSRAAGTQCKLSALLSGALWCLVFYRYISGAAAAPRLNRLESTLKAVGDRSFGVFFCHIAVLRLLSALPLGARYLVFPANAAISVLLSFWLVWLIQRILGRYSRWLAC